MFFHFFTFIFWYKLIKMAKKKTKILVKDGDSVTVNYTGKLEDGSVFDSSFNEGRGPLSATLGANQLIPGFEKGLIGMGIGDKKVVEIAPFEAYGNYRPDMVSEIEKSKFPEDVTVGSTLQGMSQAGPVIVTVLEVNEDTVKVDANHPLAGKKLIFEIEVVSVN